MGAKPDPDDELLTFAREGDVKAVYLLCEEREPESIDALVELIAPDGVVPREVFDGLADGYDLWREGVALDGAPEVAAT